MVILFCLQLVSVEINIYVASFCLASIYVPYIYKSAYTQKVTKYKLINLITLTVLNFAGIEG